MAKVKLRAFEIHNPDINAKQSDICNKLRQYLNTSQEVNPRRMLLNAEDPQKEEDFISDFPKGTQDPSPMFCTMLRVALGNNVQHIHDSLFSRPNFTIAELNSTVVDAAAIYKDHYYFSLTNEFLITNLAGNITVTRLQTYLNWLLQGLYEIAPMVSENVIKDLSEIKNITVKDSQIYPSASQSNQSGTSKTSISLGNAAWEWIRSAVVDTTTLNDVELEQMISAKLVIEFLKPKKSDSDAIKKAYSALLKPVSDLENFEFLTKNNKKVMKGSTVLRTKEVNIETTDSGHLNESQLSQEMNRFIVELQNEKQKAHP